MKKYIANINLYLLLILLVFFFVYSSISLVNHYFFRTYAADLGMFNHALWNFAHFKSNEVTLNFDKDNINYFGDHFSPITLLFSPLYYLFGSYALLLVQIVSILFGGVGIYKYAKLYFTDQKWLQLIFVLHFFGIWGIYSALSYDYHNNVVAAMFVPWLLYYYETQQKKGFLIFYVLILIAKENMALWLCFILLALILSHWKKGWKDLLKFEIPLLLFTMIYFVTVLSIIMPYLNRNADTSEVAIYSHLGSSLPEILLNMIKRPGYILSLLYKNPTGDIVFDGIKLELHYMVIASGGIAILFRPQFILFLIPIYAQKLLTNNFVLWGINAHYSIEIAPIISLALIQTCKIFNKNYLKLAVMFLATTSTYYYTYASIESRKSVWYENTNTAFYKTKHYHSELNLKAIYKALEIIPDEVPISVSSALSPHLTNRQVLYQFPEIKESQYIVLFTKQSFYPLSGEEEFKRYVVNLKASGKYNTKYDENELIIFKLK
jgi:uncharacterized membrane protein